MKLLIKQKVFSFGSKFNIFDENGEIKYVAVGEVFTFGRKLHVMDTDGNEVIPDMLKLWEDGNEVIYIEQKLLTFRPKYEINIVGNAPVEIVKEFTLFTHEYSIPDWNVKINGDFLAHEYTVTMNGYDIAVMSKEWLTWGDTYIINIPDPGNELLALAAILVVDCCMESNND